MSASASFAFMKFGVSFITVPARLGRFLIIGQEGGAAVPFVFRSGSAVLGVIPLESPESFERFMGSVRSFLGYFANARILGVYPGTRAPVILSERVAVAPLAALV